MARRPWIESKIIDTVDKKGAQELDLAAYEELLSQYILISLINIVMMPVENYLDFLLEQRMMVTLKTDLFESIIKKDLPFFENYRSGDLITLLNQDLFSI